MKSNKEYFLLSIGVFIISISALFIFKVNLILGNLLMVVIVFSVYYKNSIDIGKYLLKHNPESKQKIIFNQLKSISVFELDESMIAEIKDDDFKSKIKLTKKLLYMAFFNFFLAIVNIVIEWWYSVNEPLAF